MLLIPITILILITKYISSMDPVTLDLVTPLRQYGESCGYESCPPPKPGMINVHVVPHTHLELGGSRTFYQHYTGYDDIYDKTNMNVKRILDFVITELWTNGDRRFTLADMPYFFHWWSQRDSTVRRMVYQLVRQGRLQVVGGAWGMPDEATTSYHALIDSFTYTLRKLNSTFLECGRPLVAWQSDVYGHSREFASLAAQMGFDGLFISPIGVDDEVPRMQRGALEFLWRGSDDLGPDSDVYTHKLFDGYWSPPGFCFSTTCSDPLLITSETVLSNIDERARVFIDQILNRQAASYNTSNVMVMMGVAFGYFDANVWYKNIDKLIGAVNDRSYKTDNKIHLMYSTPACYLKAVHDAGPFLETKQDDFFPFLYDKKSYFAGMYTSRPSIKLLAREGHVYLQMAKQLQVLAKLWNNDKKFEELMWIMGVFQDHQVIAGYMRQPVKDYYVKKMYVAVQRSTLILKQAFNKLRRSPSGTIYYRCSFNVSSCGSTGRSSDLFIVVYNPLAWAVSVPVRLPVENGLFNVYDPSGEKIEAALMKIPYPVLSLPFRNTADHELVFIAENTPPLGYRSYYIEKETSKPARRKRSLIKKMKKQNKKYLIRQANTPKIDEQSLLTDMEKSDYSFTDTEINPELLILNKKYKDLLNRTKLRNKDLEIDYSEFYVTTETVAENIEIEEPKSAQDYIEVLERKSFDIPLLNFSDNINETDVAYDYKDFQLTNRRRIQDGVQKDNDIEVTMKPDETINNSVNTNETTLKTEDTRQKQTDFEQNLEDRNQTLNETELEPEATEQTPEDTRRKSVDKEEPETTTEPEKDDEQPKERKLDDVKENTEDLGQKTDTSRRMNDYVESSDLFIKNKYIRVNLDPSSKKVSSVRLSNGVATSLDVQPYYLASDAPAALGRPRDQPPGVYNMRSIDNKPVAVMEYLDARVYKNSIVEEVHYIYAEWASLVVRVYAGSPLIEVDWLVGPIPVSDGVGKEVFIRYRTDLVHGGVFYTDSNGRQTLKRIRDTRPLYQPLNPDKVAGNYYPVTSKIYIEDVAKNIRFTIFTDRTQGGTSLYDGEIDLMVHRRILTEDKGFEVVLNETHNGEGIRVRGKHYLYLSKGDFKLNKIFEKKFARELLLPPQVLVSREKPYGVSSKEIWSKHTNEFSFLSKKLPAGVHVLTIEKWNDDTILLRLENYLEKSDAVKSGVKTVFIKDLFKNLVVTSVKETALAANVWLKDVFALKWRKRENFFRNFNEFYGNFTEKPEYSDDDDLRSVEEINLEDGVRLAPQQIRTFVCWFEYTGKF